MNNIRRLIGTNDIVFKQNKKLIKLVLLYDSSENAELLTKWRKNNLRWYDSYFIPTVYKTKLWMQNMIENCNDSMLYIITVDGERVGHIGLSDYDKDDKSVSIMSVVKGENILFPRLMEIVSKGLLDYSFEKLDILKIKIRVFSDNFKAINLYERCGLLTINLVPMRRVFTEEGWTWKECSIEYNNNHYAERYMNIMEIYRNNVK
jgi:RimJ/RimL family protein N-acetyltransferase